ncbi:MAG: hypothetical protein QXN01_02215 [Candidatus Anstonellales archaeon]
MESQRLNSIFKCFDSFIGNIKKRDKLIYLTLLIVVILELFLYTNMFGVFGTDQYNRYIFFSILIICTGLVILVSCLLVEASLKILDTESEPLGEEEYHYLETLRYYIILGITTSIATSTIIIIGIGLYYQPECENKGEQANHFGLLSDLILVVLNEIESFGFLYEVLLFLIVLSLALLFIAVLSLGLAISIRLASKGKPPSLDKKKNNKVGGNVIGKK